MTFDAYTKIIVLCLVVIASYLFNFISRWTKIPSVILLLLTGVFLRIISDAIGLHLERVREYVELLGAIGLVMIVLEAALDLKISKEKFPLIRSSFLSAFVILIVSGCVSAWIIKSWLNVPFYNSFIYAITLSIISSAIVIPSIVHLTEDKKEFLIYEVSFSDILGIILFNYFIQPEILTLSSIFSFFGWLLLGAFTSFVASLILLSLLGKITTPVKFFLLFAVLMLLYAAGKIYHLPSLILILCFGLLVNNYTFLIAPRTEKFYKKEVLETTSEQLKLMTVELSFIIRTFFFILFGFSIELKTLINLKVLIVGISVVAILLLVRYCYLRFVSPTRLFPELFILPRGLITILLFYNIPQRLKIGHFSEGIILFVIIATNLLMMFGLMFCRKKEIRVFKGGNIPYYYE